AAQRTRSLPSPSRGGVPRWASFPNQARRNNGCDRDGSGTTSYAPHVARARDVPVVRRRATGAVPSRVCSTWTRRASLVERWLRLALLSANVGTLCLCAPLNAGAPFVRVDGRVGVADFYAVAVCLAGR